MHKTGACLQMLGLRGAPRWQARKLAPGLPRGQLLAREWARSLRRRGCNLINSMSKIYVWHGMQFSNYNCMVNDWLNKVEVNLTTGDFCGILGKSRSSLVKLLGRIILVFHWFSFSCFSEILVRFLAEFIGVRFIILSNLSLLFLFFYAFKVGLNYKLVL